MHTILHALPQNSGEHVLALQSLTTYNFDERKLNCVSLNSIL